MPKNYWLPKSLRGTRPLEAEREEIQQQAAEAASDDE